jgi:hypothetical protein
MNFLKWFHKRKQPPQVTKRDGRSSAGHLRRRPRLEALEDRIAPAVQLLYNGISGNPLTLTERVPGATSPVIITDNNTAILTITLPVGSSFDPSSSPAFGQLSYPLANEAQVVIGGPNTISNLTTNLPGDTLTLGNLANFFGGVSNINASANTVTVSGAVHTDDSGQLPGTGNIVLTASTNISLISFSSLHSAAGNITLMANQNGAAAGNFAGIIMQPDATVETTGVGNVVLQGQGGNDASTAGQAGVVVEVATVESVGTGSITVIGTGGQSSSGGGGVVFFDASATSVSGPITI